MPDFAPPRAEWMRGDPSELTDASYWPSMDVPVPQDSDETSVRYFNGELQIRVKDVGSNGFGLPWGHSRIYSNRLSNSFNFGNGTNWLVHEWPQLVRLKGSPEEITAFHPGFIAEFSGCTMVMLRGTRNAVWFDELKSASQDTPSIWVARFGAKHRLEYNSQKKNFRVITANGQKWEFYPFTRPCYTPKNQSEEARDRRLDGRLIRHVDPAGNVIKASYENGKLKKYERSGEGGSESFNYDYFTSGDFKGLLQYVTWERGKPLERVEYTYYGKNDSNGKLGDLQTAKTAIQVDGEWKHRENSVHYYRYYTESNDTYCQGLLKYVVSPENYGRLAAQYGNPLSASDQTIRGFADIALTYTTDSDSFQARRVKTISLFGGVRQHSFEYQLKDSSRRGVLPPQLGSKSKTSLFATWHTSTIETKADGTQCTIWSNFIGQPLRQDVSSQAGKWTSSWKYDPLHAGLTDFYLPSTVSDSRIDPETALPSYQGITGRHQQFTYSVSSVIYKSAYLQSVSEISGESGQKTLLKTFEYKDVEQTYGIRAVSQEISHGVGITLQGDLQDAKLRFDTDFSNTDINQDTEDGLACLRRRVTTLPAVDVSHFPGFSDFLTPGLQGVISEDFDNYGNLIELRDQRGTTTRYQVDVPKRVPISETISYQDGKRTKELQFDYKSDEIGRVIEVLGPWHLATINIGEPEKLVRTATWYVYKTLSGEVWTSQGYMLGSEAICINPIMVTRYDLGNREVDQIAVTRRQTGRPNERETFPRSSWCRWIHQEYTTSTLGHLKRVYHAIPADGNGTVGVNFTETQTSNDIQVRRRSVSVSQGTNYQVEFDPRGLPLRVKMGSSDAAMQEVLEAEYDNGRSGGNGNLTTLRRFDGQQARISKFEYDIRDRQKKVVESDGTQVEYEFNQHNTVRKMVRSSSSKTKKLAEKFQFVDVRGRVYQQRLSGFDISGNPLQPLSENFLFNEANQLVAYEGHGSNVDVTLPSGVVNATPIRTFSYDGLGRQVLLQVGVMRREGGTGGPVFPIYLFAFDVYQSSKITYNDAGDPIVASTSRLLPASGASVPGVPIGGTQIGSDSATWTSSTGSWFDPLGRKLATSDFGSTRLEGFNHRITNSSRFPTTISEFDERGDVSLLLDPNRNMTRLGYDHAGRTIASAKNLNSNQFSQIANAGSNIGAIALDDDTAFTQTRFNSESAISGQLFGNTHTGAQSLSVKYASDVGGFANGAPSGRLPTSIIDPQGRQLDISYNPLGEVVSRRDANGTVHQYSFDNAGRIISDSIVSYAPGMIDASVLRIEYGYDEFGRLSNVDSFDSPSGGNRLNSVVRKYGSFNELLVEAQLHSPDEVAFTSNTKLFHGDYDSWNAPIFAKSIPGHIGYYYKYPSFSRNDLRLVTTWYPGDANSPLGRRINRVSNVVDASLDRTTGISDTLSRGGVGDAVAGLVTSYKYLGADTIYGTEVAANRLVSLRQSLSESNGKPFSSLDFLGREKNRVWTVGPFFDVASRSTVEDISITRDFNDNILSRRQNLSNSGQDDLFTYDRLDRLRSQHRGSLSLQELPPRILGRGKYRQEWSKDQSGNWKQWRKDLFDVAHPSSTVQLRSHSLDNEIVAFHLAPWAQPQYDNSGLMTRLPQPDNPLRGIDARYDAWGRLTVIVDGNGLRTEFEYDGLGRRIVERPPSKTEHHFYYDQEGNLISEFLKRQNSREMTLDREYVWSPNGRRLAYRLRYNVPSLGGGIEQLFPLHDMEGQAVALADTSGNIVERYTYDPQGHFTVLQPNFQPSPNPSSAFEWEHFGAAAKYDRFTGLHFVGAGYYHADLGRMLPNGQVTVLPESQLNSYVSSFPMGAFRPNENSFESVLKFIGEMPFWLKVTIGAVAVGVAIGCVIAAPWTGMLLLAAGAAAGAAQGGIGAALSGGDTGDVILSAGVGAAFGAICPFGAIGGLIGSAIGFNGAKLLGYDGDTAARAWELGGLVGGVGGDFYGAYTQASKELLQIGIRNRKSLAMLSGLAHVGPDLLGAGAGAMIGFGANGPNGVYHGATLGMMVGSFTGAGFRVLWSVRRAKAPNRVFATGTSSDGGKLLEGGLDAAQSFDSMLTRLFRETNSGEFQGIWLNRQTLYTQFHDGDLAIYFRRNADITGRIVGEEVQHAIDFTMGATRHRIAAEAAARGVADADVNQWWHRRVFTRQLQNIHADQHGMGLLRGYSDDVYRAYQQQGGKLTLEEILTRKFNGLY